MLCTVLQIMVFLLGTIGYGIATARAFLEGQLNGCWSSTALTLNAALMALLVPAFVQLFRWLAG